MSGADFGQISTVPLVIFLVISGIIGMFREGLLIILPFMVIRKFSGGYHAKHAYICMIMSTGLLAGCLDAVSHFPGSRLMPLFLLVSGISIAINSPIDHENKRLTEQEKMRYQRTTIGLVLAACFVSVVMNVMGYNRYSSCVALGVILTGVLHAAAAGNYQEDNAMISCRALYTEDRKRVLHRLYES